MEVVWVGYGLRQSCRQDVAIESCRSMWRPLQSQTSAMLMMMEARCGDRELSIDPEASAISNLSDADDDGGKMWRQRVVDRSGGLCNLKPHQCGRCWRQDVAMESRRSIWRQLCRALK